MPQEILWFQQVSLNCSSKMQRMTSLLVVYTLGSAQLTTWWAFSYTEEVFATHQKGFTREKEGKAFFCFFLLLHQFRIFNNVNSKKHICLQNGHK